MALFSSSISMSLFIPLSHCTAPLSHPGFPFRRNSFCDRQQKTRARNSLQCTLTHLSWIKPYIPIPRHFQNQNLRLLYVKQLVTIQWTPWLNRVPFSHLPFDLTVEHLGLRMDASDVSFAYGIVVNETTTNSPLCNCLLTSKEEFLPEPWSSPALRSPPPWWNRHRHHTTSWKTCNEDGAAHTRRDHHYLQTLAVPVQESLKTPA